MVAPSSFVLLLDCGIPLACVTIDRCGLPESECASTGGVKPGRILYRTWKFRPCELMSGRSVIWEDRIWLLISARSVCRATAPAFTMTLSVTWDNDKLASRRNTLFRLTTAFSNTRVENAGAEIVTLYVPGSRSLNR